MPRNASTHAAGVVITKEPVDHYVPLSMNGDQPVTQFTMVTLEELGLLKMDFLGLRNLTVIADAEKMVRLREPGFSMEDAPLDDAATFEMLGQGKTMGVFQLESAGITNVVTGLRPQSIEDITAVVALYRCLLYTSLLDEASPSCHNLEASRVISIRNDFFGEGVSVAGLITGQDLVRQLRGRALGERVLISANMLRDGGDVFLDDMMPGQVGEALGVPLVPVEIDGADPLRKIFES